MKLIKNILLIIPVRLSIKLLELWIDITKNKNGKAYGLWKRAVMCDVNKWFWEINNPIEE